MVVAFADVISPTCSSRGIHTVNHVYTHTKHISMNTEKILTRLLYSIYTYESCRRKKVRAWGT